MEIRYVRAFLAICEELHFGRAAARLHLAQPTLSDHLRHLERAVGARLVERGPRGVALTDAGRAFEPAARRGLAELDAAAVAAGEIGSGTAGTVRIGFNFPAGSRVLPPTLRALRADHPRLRTVLTELRSGPQLAAVADGRLDLGFVFGRPDRPGLAHRPVLRTRLVAVVARTHPLARRRSVRFTELADHPCVLFDRELSPASHDALVHGARAAGCALQVVDEIDDAGGTAVVVAAGTVVGFASVVRAGGGGDGLTTAGLTAVGITDPEPVLEVSAVWDRGTRLPALHRVLECLDRVGPFTDGSPPDLE